MSSTTPRVAVITGSAQGIGRAIALRLADDGLDVVLNDLPSKVHALEEVLTLIKEKGRKAIYVIGDVSVQADVQKLIDETVSQLGGIDVMVANAGIAFFTQLLDSPLADWQKIWDVDAKGVFLCYQLAARQMVKQGRGGRIIGASSIEGKKGFGNLGACSAAKFAVRGLTQTAAVELAEYNIQVNAYAPGFIETLIVSTIGVERAKEVMNVPHAKLGKPEDISNIVSYLASPEAWFITGQTLVVDGGLCPT